MSISLYLLIIAFGFSSTCPKNTPEVCKAEAPEIIVYSNIESAVVDGDNIARDCASYKIYKVTATFGGNPFGIPKIEVSHVYAKKSYKYDIIESTKAVYVW